MTAKSPHPARSSSIAADITIAPSSVFIRCRSIRMRAITGSAEMDKMVPTKSASRGTLLCALLRQNSGHNSTDPTPSASGARMPRNLDQMMGGPRVRRRLGCSSRPAMNTKSSNPNSVTRSEEHTSELQSLMHLVCRLLVDKNVLGVGACPLGRLGKQAYPASSLQPQA